MGLGGKPVFVHLTGFGLVTRQRQFGFPASWDGPLSICSWYRYHEHMLMVPVPWAYAHGTRTISIWPWHRYREPMLRGPCKAPENQIGVGA